MNIFLWIVLVGFILFTGLRLLYKKHRSTYHIYQFIKAVVIVIGITLFITTTNTSFVLACIVGSLLFILLDKKTYTKRRLLIYGASTISIIIIAIIGLYIAFKDNPEYPLKHLAKNPEITSLYVSMNDEEMIAYQSDVPRPLASVVKIIIAIEYAYQIDAGKIHPDDKVSLDRLEHFYVKNSDGGAHEAWMEELEEEGEINNTVSLHHVAEGMITFSSNANAEYLMNLLGEEEINKRMTALELNKHEDIVPIVGSLLAIVAYKNQNEDDDTLSYLQAMPLDDYIELSLQQSEKIANNEQSLSFDVSDISMKEQRIWSDRLANASAETYGELLQKLTNDDFPTDVAKTIRDLMEWPMEMVEGNDEQYHYLGAKGGSTAFVYNQAMYMEDLDGNKMQLVLFMDDLTTWQSLMIQEHANSFIIEMFHDDEFREKVQSELASTN